MKFLSLISLSIFLASPVFAVKMPEDYCSGQHQAGRFDSSVSTPDTDYSEYVASNLNSKARKNQKEKRLKSGETTNFPGGN